VFVSLTASKCFCFLTLAELWNSITLTTMTIYDYMTPFEDDGHSQEGVSPVVRLPQAMAEKRTTTSSASLETSCLDSKVPELHHCASTTPTSSDIDSAPAPYHGSGLVHTAEILIPEKPLCCGCADNFGVSEPKESGPETNKSPDHCHRCHSLLNGGAFPVLQPNFDTTEEQYDNHKHVETLLHDECSPLEQESNLLERESALLEYEASPLEQVAHPLETLDIAMSAYTTEAREQESQLKAMKEEWKGHSPSPESQKWPLIGNGRLPPTYYLQIYGCRNYNGDPRPKVPGSGLPPVSYYGKYL
jgi:hypothetical protein